MSGANKQLKTAVIIAALILLSGIAILLVWFLSPAWVTVTPKILLTAFILLLWPVGVLISYYFRQRQPQPSTAETAPGGAHAGAGRKQKKAAQLPAPTGNYEELTRGAEEVVQWLRGTKLSGGAGEARAAAATTALYALPWFAVAGPAASGKTSLLLASDLSFHVLPSQRASEQNLIRPTAHSEWRVADAAILIDTSGRYQTEGAERDEWAALIETIKKHRRARPLDGFVLAVSAAAILRMPDSEIEQQAKILRARLDEALLRAQVRFPVYLVFTHMDELEGFAEFFSSFDAEERRQVWGSTIPLAHSENAHALFDAEFDYLYGRLLRRRMVQLAAAPPPDGAAQMSGRQLRIFKFPGRFRRTKSRLGHFTSVLFRPNPFSESPLLRGFYFTSSGGGSGPAGAPRRSEGAEYFTSNLFREVLLRDKDIVAAAQAGQRRPHLWRNFLLGVAALLAALFFVGMIVSFFNNKELIAEADARGRKLTEIRKVASREGAAGAAPATGEELRAIEEVRQLLSELDDYERTSPPLLLRFGLYSGARLNSSDPRNPSILRHLYFEAIDERFLKPTIAMIEKDLRAFVADAAPKSNSAADPASPAAAQFSGADEDALGRHYDLLKAYLMLVEPERVEPTFLANELRSYWQQSAPPGLAEDSLKQLEFFAGQARYADAPHPEVDKALIAQAQNKLIAYPVVNRVYKRMTAEVDQAVKYPVRLTTIPGAREGNLLTSSYSVPGSFTVDGYRAMTEKLQSSAADEFRKDDWVMAGDGGGGAAAQNLDVKQEELANMYQRDYVAQWQKFLQEVKVRNYQTKEEATRALALLAGSNSPLESVLREVARQTNLSAATGGGLTGWIKKLFSSRAGGGNSTQVEKEFRPLIQFMTGSGDASPMAEYRAKLKNVQDGLNAKPKPLGEISNAVLAGKDQVGLGPARRAVADLLEAKNFGATPASDAAGKLLRQPLENLNVLLVGTDYEQIEKIWQQLYARAQALEAGFPFSASGTDVSLSGLAQFLNPQDGDLTKFFEERLKPYFEEDWSLKGDAADKFSPEFVSYLKNARRLRGALFPAGGKQPKVEYQLAIAPVQEALVRVEIDGNTISMPEKPSANFVFPGDKSGAKITVTPLAGEDQTKSATGEWGVLRLFAEGGGGQGKGAQFELQYQLGVPVRLTLQPKSGTIFDRELFTSLKAPKSLQRSP